MKHDFGQNDSQPIYTIKTYRVQGNLIIEGYFPTTKHLFIKKVISLEEDIIREELIKLGWTPPKE